MTRLTPTGCRRRVAVFVLAVCGASIASAQDPPILLLVNPSNPAAVTVTSTGAAPAVDFTVTESQPGDGVSSVSVLLAGLFPSAAEVSPSDEIEGGFSGTLTADTGAGFPIVFGGDFTAPGSPADFSVFGFADQTGSGPPSLLVFSTGLPAFTGQGVLDTTGPQYALVELPPLGATGVIRPAEEGVAFGPVLGRYVVVPEPASVVVLAVAALRLVVRRRRV